MLADRIPDLMFIRGMAHTFMQHPAWEAPIRQFIMYNNSTYKSFSFFIFILHLPQDGLGQEEKMTKQGQANLNKQLKLDQ